MRAESERAPGVGERLGAASVPLERPRKDVVAVDARARASRLPRGRKRAPKPDAVVGVELCNLEVGAHAVRGEQPPDHVDERVLPLCGATTTVSRVQVAERRDCLRKRKHIRRTSRERERGAVAAPRLLDERERLERVDVAGKDRERGAVVRLRFSDPAMRPGELAELRLHPGGRLRLAAGRVERERHRLLRRIRPAEQLTRVRDPRIRREVGSQRAHVVERPERLVVAAELDQRVADDAVVAGRVRSESHRLASEDQRVAEPVPGQGERSEGARRRRIPWVELARAVERLLGLRVVRGVPRLAGALLVGEPEQCVALRLAGVRAQLVDEPPDERRRVTAGEPCREALARGRGLHGQRAGAATRVPERPADERDGGDECRRRPCENESRLLRHVPTGCRAVGFARRTAWRGTGSCRRAQRRPCSPRRMRGPRCSWDRRRRGSRCR